MPYKILSSSIVTSAVLLSLGSATSMAQEAPPPSYYAPPPQPYPPQPYPPQAYPPQAYAAPPPAPGYHEHDGFYLRLLLGVGYLYNSTSYLSEKVSGVGGTFGVALGGSLNSNLVIYGELLGTSVSDPTIEVSGTSGTASGRTATMAGIGPGVAYYLDGNLYLSGTLLFTKLSISNTNTNDQVASTDWGIGAGLTVGKEWWVSRDWGLGVSGQFQAASMKDHGADNRWTGISASLLFSATCN